MSLRQNLIPNVADWVKTYWKLISVAVVIVALSATIIFLALALASTGEAEEPTPLPSSTPAHTPQATPSITASPSPTPTPSVEVTEPTQAEETTPTNQEPRSYQYEPVETAPQAPESTTPAKKPGPTPEEIASVRADRAYFEDQIMQSDARLSQATAHLQTRQYHLSVAELYNDEPRAVIIRADIQSIEADINSERRFGDTLRADLNKLPKW